MEGLLEDGQIKIKWAEKKRREVRGIRENWQSTMTNDSANGGFAPWERKHLHYKTFASIKPGGTTCSRL